MRNFFRRLCQKIERTAVQIHRTVRVIARVMDYYGVWKILAQLREVAPVLV